MKTTLSIYEQRAHSSPVKNTYQRVSKTKLKKIKAPQKHWTLSLGKPLIPDTLLVSLGMSATCLHAWYMGKTNETRTQCPTGFTVKYTARHFLYEPDFFVVGFDDLFDLFNFDALDASLLRCWTL